MSLLPCEVMKSIDTSTFSLAAQSLTSALIASLAPGTQWSQNPIESLPAAWAPRTNGAEIIVADAAAVRVVNCRRVSPFFDMAFLPIAPGCSGIDWIAGRMFRLLLSLAKACGDISTCCGAMTLPLLLQCRLVAFALKRREETSRLLASL